jgi:DNA-directed RNA polymerase specialized sigma24 family protein
MPVNRIATAMGANKNTVLSWLRRGRKTLEKMLKEEV